MSTIHSDSERRERLLPLTQLERECVLCYVTAPLE